MTDEWKESTGPALGTEEEEPEEFVFPASFAQQRLWVIDQFMPGSSLYNNSFAVRFTGPLRAEVLEEVLNEIVWRHEVLRTTFDLEEEELVQVVISRLDLPLPVLSLEGLSRTEQDEQVCAWYAAEEGEPFDLRKGPLLRAKLLRLQDEEHVLLFTMHHIISDGWSTGVLVREMVALYECFSKGLPSPLPDLPIQYADYAAWQQDFLQGEVLDEQLGYWKKQLGGELPVLQLPTDRPRQAVQTYQGAAEQLRIDPETAKKLGELSKRSGATLFMTLLAAFQTLLYRICGQDDVPVGTPIAGRSQGETEELIGFFVNTLVLRGDLSGNPTFTELLERVKQMTYGAYDHQEIPFEKLVKELQPEREMSLSPLFQVMFVLQNAPRPEIKLSEITLQSLEFESKQARFDLTMTMMEQEDGLLAVLEYNTDLFTQATIDRLLGHFDVLLGAIAANPEQKVGELPLLTDAETRQMLVEWNDTAAPYPHTLTIHERFAQIAALYPEQKAASDLHVSLTYRELDERSNQLAYVLREQGVAPNQLVGIVMERGALAIAAILGVLKAGGAYVMIDPEYPEERIAYLLEDSGAQLVVTQNSLQSRFVDSPHRTLCIEDTAGAPADALAVVNTNQDLAYVIYTSGSTGRPKGTLVRHIGVLNLAQWKADEFGYGPDETVLQFASLSFDTSVEELFGCLLNGVDMYVLKGDERQSISGLIGAVERTGATMLTLPTVFFTQTGSLLSPADEAKLATVKRIFVAGEALTASAVRTWQKRFGTQIEIVNEYGPTEATVCATFYRVPHHLAAGDTAMSIGKPLPNMQIYILSPEGMPCPVGVTGELHIGSIGLAVGYHKQPEKTGDVLIPHPFSTEEGARLYKTGDLARYLPDGSIEYVGRRDHQVKIRGFRIELGEIEQVLMQHEAVQEAVVIAREDVPGEKRLVAYAVAEKGCEAADLRSFLQAGLPDYMVPSAFVLLDEFPLTPNRKVDRTKLPAPDHTVSERKAAYTAPRNEVEQLLADVWAAVLRVERVGIHDNFFELGGDSILSIQIIHRAGQRGLHLSPRDLFQHRTIAELALAAGSGEKAVEAAKQGAVTGEVLLTPIQHWFFEQNLPAPHHWNMPLMLELSGGVDMDRLRAALKTLLNHHDALRMRFVQEGGVWKQSNGDMLDEAPFATVNLTGVADFEAAFLEEAAKWQGSLDLADGPLFRAVHFTFGGVQNDRLLLVVHHLVIDGVSWRILLQDLETAYGQQALPPKTTSFQDWAEKLNACAPAEKEFWLQLAEREALALPVDHDGDNTVASRRQVTVGLSADETQKLLREASKAYNTEINDLLLTALAQAVAKWSGSNDVLVTLEGHGREDIFSGVDVSRTVGWFTTTYPVLLQVRDEPGRSLKAVKEQLRAIPNKGIGYGVLRYLQGVKELASVKPQLGFNYLGQFDQLLEEASLVTLSEADSGPAVDAGGQREHLLDIVGGVAGGLLQMNFAYSANVYEQETVEKLAGSFADELRELILHCVSAEAGAFTPSDVPEARLGQQELDMFMDAQGFTKNSIGQLYELSPAQQGMMFHSLLTPEAGVYVAQLSLELQGKLDHSALKCALQSVLERHTILRTSFHAREDGHPLQAVHKRVEMPIVELNETADWQSFAKQDRARGFDLTQAPLMRLAIIKTGEDQQRLILTTHHLILDGWSMPLMFKEIFAYYMAYADGRGLELPAQRPYREFIAWLQRQDEAAAEAFWREKLAGFRAPTVLGIEQKGLELAADEARYADLETLLTPELSGGLQAFAKAHELTLNTLVQGAYAILLSRYSGESDLVYGATVSGRPADLPGVEAMIGLFINTLPMRVQVGAEEGVLEFLQRLQEEQLAVRDYEYAPLVSIQSWSDVPRDLQLFRTIFVFENYPMDETMADGLHGLAVTDIESGEITNYPLTFVAAPGEQVLLKVSYDRTAFADRAMARLVDHMETLLGGIVADGEMRIGQLPMMTPAEQEEMLVAWNETTVPFPSELTIPEAFAMQVQHAPQKIAVSDAETELTYRELDERSNRVASVLRERGVAAGQIVAVQMERSVRLITAILGVLQAGGAYLAIDPKLPAERIAYLLEDSGASLVVTEELFTEIQRTPLETSRSGACVATDEAQRAAQEDNDALLAAAEHAPSTLLTKASAPEDPAYMIYTSGSTGLPKGTLLSHRGVLNLAQWTGQLFAKPGEQTLLQFASFSFDAAVWEMHSALLNGMRLHLLTEDERHSAEALADAAARVQATFVLLPTALFNQIGRDLSPEGAEKLSALHTIFVGGEALTGEAVRAFRRRAGEGIRLINAYGPTEATVIASAFEVPSELSEQMANLPIGRPLANTELYILSPDVLPCPVQVVGELYIGGTGLALGYRNQPEKTAAAFLPHPFRKGACLYRTGDLARFLPDGTIEYMGRVDDQVKVRGFRIELGEIESVLLAHPAVSNAAVVVREDVPGDKRIVGYVAAAGAVDPQELRGYLKSRLPEYMVPLLVLLDRLPQNASGKVDRRALPAPDLTLATREKAYVPPQNEAERQVAQIFAEVLRVEQVGRFDSFFELGGHSLLATQVVSRLNTAFAAQLPLRTLFEAATAAELAAAVTALQGAGETDRIVPVERTGHLPLSYAQQRLWLLEKLTPGTSTYHLPFAVRLNGKLDVQALERSLNDIVARHEALRTSFAEANGEPMQVITPYVPFTIPAETAATEAELLEKVELAAQRPFDLQNGPLWRFQLLKLQEEEQVLALTLHHIVSDGWSMDVLVEEFMTLYAAHVNGEDPQLPPLPVQYADYSVWQRNMLADGELERQMGNWRENLHGELPVLQLPTDRPRPPVQTHRGGVVRFTVGRDVAEGLQRQALAGGATLFMTLLAAYQALLSRYTGQEDILIGTPSAGRTRREVEGLIGFFVNTLVLRGDLSGNPSFRELQSRMREASLNAFAHGDVPFEKLVEELEPVRDLSRSPLFQTLFTLQNAPRAELQVPGLELSQLEQAQIAAKFDLELTMAEAQDGLYGAFTYNADLFDAGTIERMAGHLTVLLRAVAENAELRLSDLPLLTEGEEEQLHAWNGDHAGLLASDLPVHHLFERQAAKTPEHTAVEFAGESLTYRELNESANRLAYVLRAEGVGPDVRVGLYVERSLELVIGLLAILKAGGAYVPVDPAYPQERIDYIFADSRAPLAVTQPHLAATLQNVKTILISEVTEGSADDLQVDIAADHLAYMIYTSGSTGKPKAVMVEHGSLTSTLLASQEQFGFAADTVMPWIASAAFDIALFELFNPLLCGGKTVVLSREQVLDLPQLAEDLGSWTAIHTVPSLMRSLLQQGVTEDCADSIRLIFIGGDAVAPDLLDEMRRTFKRAAIHVLYGPTEGTIICAAHRVPEEGPLDRFLIGQRLPSALLRVCDRHGNATPAGVPGELWIGGRIVTRGYFRRDDLTAEKYVEADGARWYKTGDLVRRLVDGTLEFLGRIDNQVKIRGFRIELGEIETMLTAHPSVQEATVIVRESTGGEKSLAAYFTADAALEAAELRSYLKQALPDYMVPGAFVQLDALPLNQNGKIDRRALPEPDAAAESQDFAAPRTPQEELVAGIFAEVLGLERVGTTDNFFERGGHSLLATQVVSRLSAAFGVEIPLRSLFEAPTVADLSDRIGEQVQSERGASRPSLVRTSRDNALPLSFAQQRLWVLDRLSGGDALYNMPFAVRLQGALDVEVIETALNGIVHRHEALRTTFRIVDGHPQQVIADQAWLPLPVTEVASAAEALAILHDQAEAPFDLEKGPLVRFTLLKRSDEEHILLVNLHHIVADGWSMGIFIREFAALAAGQTLAELPVQYADFAAWQRGWLQGDVLDEQLAYWKQQLGGELPVLQLPTDRPRPAEQTHRGAAVKFELPAEVRDSLQALSRKHGVTLFMTLLAAFQTLLYRYTGQQDLTVGTPIAGRGHRELEGLIGFFVNTLVLRGDLSGNPTVAELLGRTRETALGAYAHQDVPFEKLVDALQPERDMSISPLFQAFFALQNAPVSSAATQALEGLTLSAVELAAATAKFDLELSMEEQADGLTAVWTYNTDLFDEHTMQRMIGHFRTLLTGFAQDSHLRLSELPLLAEQERDLLVGEWGGESTAEEETLVYRAFEAQAARTPDATAVRFEEESLTYRELNERANRLALHLQAAGIGTESRVALCLERSLELVVSILAVWKAGGAYVPLDPSYPQERIAMILEDAGAGVLVTQEHLLTALPLTDVLTVCVDRDAALWAEHAGENLQAAVGGDNLAYMIYTSGSTGKPKAVMVEQHSLAGVLRASRETFGFTATDVMPWIASAAFDIALFELMNPLLTGGKAVVLTRGHVLDLPRLLRDLEGWTMIHTVPSLMRQIVGRIREAGIDPSRYDSIRKIYIGGDAVPPDLLTAMYDVFQQAQIHVLYGPTEGTIICAHYPVPRGEAVEKFWVGRRLPHAMLRVCDADGNLTPPGVPGELYIGGTAVTRGYYRREDLTAEKYIEQAGVRWYKTGDSVRYTAEGSLEFLGRIDHQVKIRGFRIELGEIETLLTAFEAVKEALVLVREAAGGDKRLIAYVVPESGQTVSAQELRAGLMAKVPDYMVPSAFVVLEAMPLNPNGKIDRRALPEPELTAVAVQTPRSEVEQILADVWAEVLHVPAVGIHDNFFELGGDSILSIQVIHRAGQKGVRLTPKDLFKYQTIAALAEVAGRMEDTPEEQGAVTGDVLLTPVQHQFLAQQLPEPHHFNMTLLFDLHEHVEEAALRDVILHLLNHHDALRLRFQDGGAYQTEPLQEAPLAVVAAGADFAEETARWQASLDLANGPLIRFVLFRTEEGQPDRLLAVAHHLVIDAVSWRILLEDLQTALEQRLAGAEIRLPLKTTSFQKWAQTLSDQLPRHELPYWAGLAEAAPLPVDFQGGDNTFASAQAVSVTLGEDETHALLTGASKAYNTRIDDLLLTALAGAFADWSGERSLLLTLEGHGREDLFPGVDVTRTVGWFTASYPVQLRLPDGEGAGERIKAVKEQLRAVPNRGIGYGQLRYLGGEKALHAPFEPQVSFNYLGQFGGGGAKAETAEKARLTLSGLSAGPQQSGRNPRGHLLEVGGVVTDGELTLSITYSAAVHVRATIERLAASFKEQVQTLIGHCLAPHAGGLTPSDVPQARLEQAELDRFLAGLAIDQKEIEQLYELSPMQQGMLFHTLLGSDTGVYVTQIRLQPQGLLDLDRLKHAFEHVMSRHEILRASFHYSGLNTPLQAVRKHPQLPMETLDWRDAAPAEQAERLHALLKADSLRGFELENAPLLRLTAIRTGADAQQLILTAHHLILDGWSLPLFVNELFESYEHPARQLPPSSSYREFIHWLQAQDADAAERYWRGKLAGFLAPTRLGIESGRETLLEGMERHADYELLLDADTTARMNELARKQQLTLNTAVQGAWSLLLSRYSGEEDIVYGSTVSGRPSGLPGVETMIGLFINTLPVRPQLSSGETVQEFLHRLQAEQAEAREYEYAPLARVQEWSEVAAGTPLFDTILVFENFPLQEAAGDAHEGGLTLEDVTAGAETNFPLAVAVMPGRELKVKVSYDRLRYEDSAVAALTGHLLLLLQGMLEQPERTLSALPMITAEEQAQLARWQELPAEIAPGASIPALFAEQAAKTPDAAALVFAGETLTYRFLNEQANRIAHYLQGQGVGANVPVGLSMERSAEMIIGLLAIAKAGGAYVPIDPAYPQERQAYLLADSGVRLLLTQAHLKDRLPAHAAEVICLDADADLFAAHSTDNPAAAVTADDLAYITYTSGSTGQPKGVMIPHRGVVRLVKDTEYVSFTANEVFLQFASISFDAATFEIWGALLNGAKLAVFPPVLPSVAELGRVLRAEGVTTAFLTTALFHQLADEHLDDFGSLRQLLVGGEVMSVAHLKKVLAKLPHCSFHHVYGPTESTTFASCYPLRDLRAIGRSLPIGGPIRGTELYVLDEHLQQVPVGVPGELHIGGEGLALGYLNQPELTAEKLIKHPFKPGARLYKTGDRVAWLADGSIEFLGRIDHQVKIRGFRIELGEIEALLGQHPAVRELVVTAREDLPGDKRLTAYVVADEGVAPRDLHRFLLAKLPGYMVPSQYVLLNSMPLNANGKVERRLLPAPTADAAVRGTEYAAPRDALEMQLVQLFESLLPAAPVGIRDSFFDLGGHSLLAVRLISEIRTSLGKELPLLALYQTGTVETLAERIREAGGAEEANTCLVRIQAGKPGVRPLYLVHPVGGNVHSYVELARLLPDRPVYGLQSRGVNAELEPFADMREMAAHYLAELRDVQPHGPYLLGGWSLGGAVAYEMAAQLRGAGEEVALLAMFDSYMPTFSGAFQVSLNEQALALGFISDLAGMFGLGGEEHAEAFAGLSAEEILSTFLRQAKERRLLPDSYQESDLVRSFRVYKANYAAYGAYSPPQSEQHVTLFKADIAPLHLPQDPGYGWGQVTSQVEVHRVPGNHFTLLQPPLVQELAEKLKQALQDL